MSIFKTKGFDSIISKNVAVTGAISVAQGSTTIIDGEASLTDLSMAPSSTDRQKCTTTVIVNGKVAPSENEQLDINIDNVTITGSVTCTSIWVEGTLAVKAGAELRAENIFYRTLEAQPGAILLGKMQHLDLCSVGEIT